MNIDEHLPEKAENMIGPMEAYGRIFNEMALPVIVELAGDAPYKIVTTLDRQYIRRPIPQIENDINIIGQITKIIEGGDQEEVYQVASANSASNRPNRHERRAAIRSGRSVENQSRETVSGPALRLNTLAIYR